MRNTLRSLIGLGAIFGMHLAYANITVPMYLVSETGKGQAVGSIELEKSKCGVLLKPDLHDLPPGIHGFHIHQHPDCGQKGMAAGGHLDPKKTDKHLGPYTQGHLGDLPVLVVNEAGKANLPALAPRFNLDEMKGHALMIHAGGDNYADLPEKLGGGGERIACGVIG